MKHTSTLRKKTLQRGAIATVVIAASALGISAWAQKEAEPASAASASTPAPTSAPAASNIPATRGQVGPQDMVTVAPHLPEAKIDGASAKDPLVRGEYLARMGDCVACHTAPGGKPFAGGLPLGSPIGTMYSSNITPDKTAGIGSYSFEEFDQAVRHGKDKRKGSLYPAMPYPSYAQVSTQDMQDLYAYFMQKVEPVSAQVPDNDIPWPLSMRWPVSIWRGMFAPNADKIQAKAETVAPTADAKLRGAYLVEGLGHCGACHTPRSFTMAEKGLDSSDSRFLSGGNAPMDGWVAKSLRGNDADGLAAWSEADIVALLKTGRNNHTAVFGGMGDVIAHSTQYISDGDLKAIAVYLKSLAAGNTRCSYWLLLGGGGVDPPPPIYVIAAAFVAGEHKGHATASNTLAGARESERAAWATPPSRVVVAAGSNAGGNSQAHDAFGATASGHTAAGGRHDAGPQPQAGLLHIGTCA